MKGLYGMYKKSVYAIILMLFFYWKKNYIIGNWIIMAVEVFLFFDNTFPKMYESNHLWTDRPISERVKIRKFKWMFKYDNHEIKELPKELYISAHLCLWGYVIASAFYWFIVSIGKPDIALGVSLFYCIITGVCDITMGMIGHRKAFILRYKRLNRFNFKYFFELSEDEEYPQLLGTGKIVSTYSKGRKTYGIICMKDDSVIYDVLLTKEISIYKNQEGKVYEICKVKYIS
ncbi:MAG: hypothetical protein PHC41_03345 [Lachnospiraceae bacterium]|nr:hypothetical protein [Lachnospiraceae bacterium]MDD3615242.1 hypothetical protein [Lachnospiraceae bacterium]